MGFHIENGVLTRYHGDGGNVAIPDGVTAIGNFAFCRCNRLTSITIPPSVTTIGDRAFSRCDSLTSVIIPPGVTTIGDSAFSCCGNLTSITIPDGVTTIGHWAFNGCSSLTSITIPDSVTAIGVRAFFGCSSLTSITIPDSVTAIWDCTFWKCSSLTSIMIPDSVTTIGNWAFKECSNLTSITIPPDVTAIGEEAFEYCSSLTNITLHSGLAKQLRSFLGKNNVPVIHIPSLSGVSPKYRPACVIGFAEDGRSLEDEDGKAYAKYIKANAAKLIGTALEHPALFYLMVREKLITAKDLEAVTDAVQKSGNAEFIAAILEYSSSVSEKDKAKVTKKKE